MEFIIRKTTADDFCFADEIVKEMEESAKIRGTGIAKRSQNISKEKMEKGDAVIAITQWNLGRILLYRNMDQW